MVMCLYFSVVLKALSIPDLFLGIKTMQNFKEKNLECFLKNDKYLNEEIHEMQSQLIN